MWDGFQPPHKSKLYKSGDIVLKNIIITFAGIAFIGSIVWAYAVRDYEPFIAIFASGATFAGCFIPQRIKKQIYHRDNASIFYGKIAEKYDERNTKFLKDSHLLTVKNLKEGIDGLEQVSILDLGGGTGINVAAHFLIELMLPGIMLILLQR